MLGWWRRLTGRGVPAGFEGTLEPDENVLAHAAVRGGGHLVATSLGLWVPGARRIGWHLISKASWNSGALVVVEAEETGAAGGAVLIRDLPPRRFVVEEPAKLPEAVQARVTGSIRSRHHRDLPGGGAWFVQRKVPGQDGVVLQVRADEGTDPALVVTIASDVAAKIAEARPVDS
ncbi:hypothetical protein [Umezawaea beigongshangensis]|uniref:hypothetical protein n=1 Tax=Umezawaea beigongshangensis TaxID=2780383 RepID=UPI0018F1C5A5|nr:hypothetical protein [Umezawaea beigongshangensis]